jgi:hypothetical protein
MKNLMKARGVMHAKRVTKAQVSVLGLLLLLSYKKAIYKCTVQGG